MAEDKTKAAGETQQPDSKKKANGDTPAPAPSKGSRFADKFGRLLNLCTELKNDHGGALDYEATLKENATLQSTVDRCKGEISSLEAQVRQLEASRSDNLELYGKKYGEYMTKLNDIDSSKQAFAETSKKLGDANKRIKELEGENKLLDKKTRTAAAELKQATRKLSESQAECKHLQASLQLAQNQIRYYGEDKLTLANLNEMYFKPQGRVNHARYTNVE
jgi:DNA repair exonuclease SbcCD ATPase subunit